MLPTPDHLRRLATSLADAERQLTRVHGRVLGATASGRWSGRAHDEFAASGALLAGSVRTIAGTCSHAARHAFRLAEHLAAERAVLRRLDHLLLPGFLRGHP